VGLWVQFGRTGCRRRVGRLCPRRRCIGGISTAGGRSIWSASASRRWHSTSGSPTQTL